MVVDRVPPRIALGRRGEICRPKKSIRVELTGERHRPPQASDGSDSDADLSDDMDSESDGGGEFDDSIRAVPISFVVGTAASARSTCSTCSAPIAEGDVRVQQDGERTWHHFDCYHSNALSDASIASLGARRTRGRTLAHSATVRVLERRGEARAAARSPFGGGRPSAPVRRDGRRLGAPAVARTDAARARNAAPCRTGAAPSHHARTRARTTAHPLSV
eukprot:SAG11_NODE_373_length_10031_cov_37.400020_14_plen_219_part_00